MNYEVKNNKVYNELGQVGVAVSPEYGCGWSSENRLNPMNAGVIVALLEGSLTEVSDVIKLYNSTESEDKKLDPLRYVSRFGIKNLEVRWVDVGTKFYIDNYDGFESLVRVEDIAWNEA